MGVGGALEGEAGVAEDDLNVGGAVGEESEIARVAGDAFDEGVDFEEGVVLAGFAVSGDGAGAEADDADVFFESGRDGGEEFAQRAIAGVIGERFAAALRIGALDAVDGGAVFEGVIFGVDDDAMDAEEAAGAEDGAGVTPDREHGDGENGGGAESEAKRSAGEREAENGRDGKGQSGTEPGFIEMRAIENKDQADSEEAESYGPGDVAEKSAASRAMVWRGTVPLRRQE